MVVQKEQTAVGLHFALQVATPNVPASIFAPEAIALLVVSKNGMRADLAIGRIGLATKLAQVVVQHRAVSKIGAAQAGLAA